MTTLYTPVFSNRFFNDFLTAFNWDSVKSSYPYNLYLNETTQDCILEYALAGFSKDDIKVKVSDTELTITAIKEEQKEAPNTIVQHKGIAERSLEAHWALANNVDKNGIKITFKDGLLHLVLPKSKCDSESYLTIED